MAATNGPLTPKERKEIEAFVLEGKTDTEIAKILGRNHVTISRYRKKNGLKKTGRGKLVIDSDAVSKESINKYVETTEDKIEHWKSYLKNSDRYKHIKKQYTDEDLDFFIEQWAVYHSELEELTPSEEDTIENLISLKIRMAHNRRHYKMSLENEEFILSHTDGNLRELDLEKESDRELYDIMMSNNRDQQELNKEYKTLLNEFNELQKSLNVTRQQREANQKIGADTFLTLIKEMNDRDKRKTIAKHNERMRIATENQTKKLKKNYNFADGKIEPMLLDGSDFIDDKGSNNGD